MATFPKRNGPVDQARRMAWLKAQPADVLAALPSANQDVTDERRLVLDRVARDMAAAGLYYAPTTPTTRWSIRRLVSQMRGEQWPPLGVW